MDIMRLISGIHLHGFPVGHDWDSVDAAVAEAVRDFPPGSAYVNDDKASRSRENCLSGYVCYGYGRDDDGTPWWSCTYVDHAYRGRLRRAWMTPGQALAKRENA